MIRKNLKLDSWLGSHVSAAPPPALIAVIALIPVLLFLYPLSNFDIWWHLDSGRWMLENGSVLTEEISSFTAVGRNWINHSWLFQVAVALTEEKFGLWGLVVLKAVLWLLLFFLLGKASVTSTKAILAFLVILFIAAPTVVNSLLLRPHLLEYIYLLCLLLLFHRRFQTSHLFLYAVLLLVWANSHASSPVGAAAVGIHLLTTKGLDPRLSAWPKRMLLAGMLGSIVFLTPNGFSILQLLLSHGSSDTLKMYITEWHRPDEYPPALAAMLFLSVYGGINKSVRFRTAEICLLLFFIFLGFNKSRFLIEITILLVRPSTIALTHVFSQTREGGKWIPTLVPILTVFIWSYLFPHQTRETSFVLGKRQPLDTSLFPVASSIALNQYSLALDRPVRVFNAYGFGGYIAWTSNDKVRIFIDGRTPTIFEEQETLEAMLSMDRPHAFSHVEKKYDIDAVLIHRLDGLAGTLDRNAWALIAYDDTSLLFVRRSSPSAVSLSYIPYDPEKYYASGITPEHIESTIKLLSLQSQNSRAWNHLGTFYANRPDRSEQDVLNAIGAFSTARRFSPNDPYTTIQLSYLLLETPDNEETIANLVFSLPDPLPLSQPSFFEVQAAEILLRIGRAPAALHMLFSQDQERATKLNLDPLTWILRAKAQLASNQPRKAGLSLHMAVLLAKPDSIAQQKDIRDIRAALNTLGPFEKDVMR